MRAPLRDGERQRIVDFAAAQPERQLDTEEKPGGGGVLDGALPLVSASRCVIVLHRRSCNFSAIPPLRALPPAIGKHGPNRILPSQPLSQPSQPPHLPGETCQTDKQTSVILSKGPRALRDTRTRPIPSGRAKSPGLTIDSVGFTDGPYDFQPLWIHPSAENTRKDLGSM